MPIIYLLQDIRLSDLTKARDKFINQAKCNVYGNFDIFINSSKGSGGTAILLNHKLNYKVFRVFKSACENAIGLDIANCGVRLSIFSIYGPRKQAKCPNFFNTLRDKINTIGKYRYFSF